MEQRYIFTILAFLGNMANMMCRDSLRIAVLAIRTEFHICQTNSSQHCGSVHWDDVTVAQVLSGYNYGMVGTMLVGGPLADMVGGKYLMLSVTMISSVCTLLVPVLAHVSLPGLVCSQVIYGLSGGMVVPALASMIVRWEPSTQRGRLATIIYSGSQASAVCCAVLTGLIIQYTDWRIVFYILAALPCLWFLPWYLLVCDSPQSSPTISQSELHLLTQYSSTCQSRPHLRDIPMMSILTSGPVWAVILANVGVSWVSAHTSLLLPQYLSGYLGLSVHDTGFLSSLPYLGCFLTGLAASLLYSYITLTRKLSVSISRKICSSICLWGFSILCLPIPLLPKNPLLGTILSTVSYSLVGFNLVGAWGNPQDICPNYVATVMGLVGLASYLVTSLVPHTLTLASYLLEEELVWPGLFILVSSVAIIANLVFVLMGSGELQPWNYLGRRGGVLEEGERTVCRDVGVGLPVTSMSTVSIAVAAELSGYKSLGGEADTQDNVMEGGEEKVWEIGDKGWATG